MHKRLNNNNRVYIVFIAAIFFTTLLLYEESALAGYNLLPDNSTKEKADIEQSFIRETAEKTVLPFCFTSPDMLFALTLGRKNTEGLKPLRASCSGQFAPQELEFITSNAKTKKLMIIDLRTDAHVFIDGYSVACPDIRPETEGLLLKQIAGLKVKVAPQPYFVLSKARRDFAPLLVTDCYTEQQLCDKNGFKYFRVSSTGLTEQLREVIQAIKDLPEDYWVHFHDFDGSVAPLFLAAADMRKNRSSAVTADDIIARNCALNQRVFDENAKNILKNLDYQQEKLK